MLVGVTVTQGLIQLSYPNGLELNCLAGEMSGVGGRNCNTGLSLESRI